MTTAILVTTYNRPEALARSLPQIAAPGCPVLVVDDGSSNTAALLNEKICLKYLIGYLDLPHNRGLAAAMNIGLSYWLADKDVEWISYFQDDVDVHPKCLEVMRNYRSVAHIMTGHDAMEHQAFESGRMDSQYCKSKWSIRATHIHATREFWQSVMPIPTRELHAPMRTRPNERGFGSNVDWWIVKDSPNSCQKTNRPILCVPGLVRSFLWEGKDSCWNNTQKVGEDAPLRTDL